MLRTKLKVSQKRQLSVPAAVRIKRLILLILIIFTLALAAFFNCSYASEMPASSDAPPSAGRPADPEKQSSALLDSGKNAEEKDQKNTRSNHSSADEIAASDLPEHRDSADPADSSDSAARPSNKNPVERMRIWQQLNSDAPDTPESLRRYVITEERVIESDDPLSGKMPDFRGFHLRSRNPVTTSTENGLRITNIYYDRNILELHFIIPPELSESGQTESCACSGLYDASFSSSGMVWDDSYSWVLGDGDPMTRESDELRVMKMTSFSGFSFSQGHPIYLEARALPDKTIRLHHQFLPPDGDTPRALHTDSLEIRGFHTLLKTIRYRYAGYELTGYQLLKKGTSEAAGGFHPINFTGQYKVLSFPSAFDAALIYRPVRYKLQLFTEEGTIHTSRYHQEKLFAHLDKNECAGGSLSSDEVCIHDYDWFLSPLFHPQSQIDENALMPAHPVTLFGKRKITLPEDPVIVPPEPSPDPEEQPSEPETPEPEEPVSPPSDPKPSEEPGSRPEIQPEPEGQPEKLPSIDPIPEEADPKDTPAEPDPEKTDHSVPSHTEESDNTSISETEGDPFPEPFAEKIQDCTEPDTPTPETADHQPLLLWLLSLLGSMGALMAFLGRRRKS